MNYYNRKGKPIDTTEWGQLLSDDSYRLVQSDNLGKVHVSTVWLGLNHNWGDGPPLIFETMIFGGEHDEDQWRYSTERDARKGHEAAVQLVRDEPAELLNREWHGDKLYGTCSKCGKLVQANKKVGGLHVCV